ncbi:HMG-box [Polyporus arcularius HHB13444]|uniref:HMG-box n=1 Tax=Polyporus arcularius HHB13444 TaxID=1314778 RepID=A0A5C3PHL2_9APHY|nr:HMG-box [Polyporus arcularius HHB13444]
MNPEMQTQFDYQRLQLIGSITHIANSMREAAAAADQMINALTYGGQNPPFPQLPNGQYAMPVMPPLPVAQDEHGKKRKSRGEDADGKKKAKKVKDPNAPKRPASSYLLFQNDVRSELKTKHPNMRNNELLGYIAKLWSEMPQEQKDKYEQRNRTAKDEWLAHKAVYESSKVGATPVPATVAAPAVPAPIAAPIPVAAPVVAETSEEEDDDEEASSGSPEASSDEDASPPPAKKSKKEVAAPTPAKEEGKKEKKHKKAKA